MALKKKIFFFPTLCISEAAAANDPENGEIG